MDDKLPWWFDRELVIPGSELDMYQLPIDPFKPAELEVVCKVWGDNPILHIYQIEIVGGKFDGSKFFAGYQWLEKYIKP